MVLYTFLVREYCKPIFIFRLTIPFEYLNIFIGGGMLEY